ncbi:hypothetical protein ACWGB8_35450 [Kitasatospora sp. NPDC054939]
MTHHTRRHESEDPTEVQAAPTMDDGVAVAEAIRREAQRLVGNHPDRMERVYELLGNTQKRLIDSGQSDIAEALSLEP